MKTLQHRQGKNHLANFPLSSHNTTHHAVGKLRGIVRKLSRNCKMTQGEQQALIFS
jgi:hypothetical protein